MITRYYSIYHAGLRWTIQYIYDALYIYIHVYYLVVYHVASLQ